VVSEDVQDLIAITPARDAGNSHSWKIGDLLVVRKQRWRVLGITPFPACTLLNLQGVDRANAGSERALLTPFDRPSVIDRPLRPRVVRRTRWMRALKDCLASLATDFQLRAAPTAQIELFPYQLEPALAVVNGLTRRILIADDVGLGKTIQAGLILAELCARHQAERVLILTPASLRSQWQSELSSRFRLAAEIVDAGTLARQVAANWRGINPWTFDGIRIVSIDFAKRPEALGPILDLQWDVLLVDEAHGAAFFTERAAAVKALAGRSRRVILLTATPHAGRLEAFIELCRSGRLEGEGPITIYRRSRARVGHAIARRVRLFRVRPTAAERDLHLALREYMRLVWRRTGEAAASRLAMIVLAKRACSSAGSLRQSLERRLAILGGAPAERQAALPFPSIGEDEAPEDRVSDEALAPRGLGDFDDETAWLERLIRLAEVAALRETKLRFISRLLRRTAEPVLIFTEYRDTLDRIVLAIGDTATSVVLHGGQSESERRTSCRQFVEGESRVLVATDAASEGLNLQDRCRLIVNLELPWNPMRLEQRIGRVDRIGQTRTVHACHLLARGTSESAILGRLVARWESARTALGHIPDPIGTLTESDIAPRLIDWPSSAVMTPAEPPKPSDSSVPGDVASPMDLEDEARREVERLTRIRRLSASMLSIESPPLASGPWITTSRKTCIVVKRPGLVLLCRVLVMDGSGQFMEETLVPLEAPLPAVCAPMRPAALRSLVSRILPSVVPECDRRIRLTLAARLDTLKAAALARGASDASRELALMHAMKARPAPVQTGLFDRRAETTLAHQECQHQQRLADGARRLAAFRLAMDRPFDVQATLILVLVSPHF
jgi:superfamily II DNA or RNA helicase